jgi:menaquinone-dependent protoporphyrinogen IX oxidase
MNRARVVVVYGANRSGPDALARQLTEALTSEGILAEACAADDVDDLEGYDAVTVENARDADHWDPFACRFARRHASELRNLPTWFLSSMPGASDGRAREQIRRWARSVAALLMEPSPHRRSRSRESACGYLGRAHHRPPGIRSRCRGRGRTAKPGSTTG